MCKLQLCKFWLTLTEIACFGKKENLWLFVHTSHFLLRIQFLVEFDAVMRSVIARYGPVAKRLKINQVARSSSNPIDPSKQQHFNEFP
jgi:hypothetical protein